MGWIQPSPWLIPPTIYNNDPPPNLLKSVVNAMRSSGKSMVPVLTILGTIFYPNLLLFLLFIALLTIEYHSQNI